MIIFAPFAEWAGRENRVAPVLTNSPLEPPPVIDKNRREQNKNRIE